MIPKFVFGLATAGRFPISNSSSSQVIISLLQDIPRSCCNPHQLPEPSVLKVIFCANLAAGFVFALNVASSRSVHPDDPHRFRFLLLHTREHLQQKEGQVARQPLRFHS